MSMAARLLEHPAAQRSARVHLHFLWQGLIMAIVAWLLLLALKRASASARYLSLVALFGVMAACPLVTFVFLSAGSDDRAQASGAQTEGIRP